jgi:hypothetical protein
MITGVHAIFYSPQAEELRSFFRDKLQLGYFDAGDGWLTFTPELGEIGCHPSEQSKEGVCLMCDDIAQTMSELKERGVDFTQEAEDWGWGIGTYIKLPGDATVMLYQPNYR